VLLFGDSGVGKTRILYAVAKFFEETIGKIKRIEPTEKHSRGTVIGGVKIKFCTVDEMIHQLRDFRDEYGGEVYLRELTSKSDMNDVLFLDDLGVEKTSDFAIEHLTMILNHRCQELLPTFISTNYLPEEMMENLGKRIYSRLQGMCKFVPVVGDDRRVNEVS